MPDPFTLTPLKPTPAVSKGRPRRTPRVPLVRLSQLLWIPILSALWLAVEIYGTPHLRFHYTWSGNPDYKTFHECDYVGLHSQRVHPQGGECPLIRFFTGQAG